MWSKHIYATRIEKAKFDILAGLEIREDRLRAINIEANNKFFLDELDTIIPKGLDYCNMWLSGLLSDYVKRCSIENDSSFLLEYYTNWLNNTIFIINGKYPSIREWCEDYKEWIIQYYKVKGHNNKSVAPMPLSPKLKPEENFRSIIQFENKDALLKRLHFLIDNKKGADVGAVLLKARLDNYITRNPTRKEFENEFELIGSWSAISNYMSDNNENALDRANKIVIFS